ncbi:TMEM175 family protein [Nocardioides sp.]|uniref:TMEM175 family protein n=1 Tax=Nocardioides sp. TaxID=35761 RepID=UPI0026385614|nr:TMEM175 family protein [Nocardioides sp.]
MTRKREVAMDDSRPVGDELIDGQFRPERMNALADGIFAVVLTLLVLELKLPETDESILTLIRDDVRVFVAWLISFLVLARFWLVHHAVTARLQVCRIGTLVLNFGVLGTVSLLPFSADLLGTERVSEPWSTIVFAVNVGLISLSLGLLARHALRERGPLHSAQSRTVLSGHRSHHLYVLPAVALASALLAFVHPYVAVGLLVAEFLVAAAWGGWRVRAPSHLVRNPAPPALEGSP